MKMPGQRRESGSFDASDGNQETGKLLKFGISSGRITRQGESYRALAQIRELRKNGVNASSKIVDNFSNRADVLAWERQAVYGLRDRLTLSDEVLPLNFRP